LHLATPAGHKTQHSVTVIDNEEYQSRKTLKEMTPAIPYIYIVVCSIIGTYFWLKILRILKDNDYETNGVMTLVDYTSFSHLIKNEVDPILKKKYRRMYLIQIILIPITFIGYFLIQLIFS
jgi:hypothetical protein